MYRSILYFRQARKASGRFAPSTARTAPAPAGLLLHTSWSTCMPPACLLQQKCLQQKCLKTLAQLQRQRILFVLKVIVNLLVFLQLIIRVGYYFCSVP